jgi:DEAD/DEAH box helicase domain-containing protein
MPIDHLLADLRGDDRFMANVVAWRTLHAQAARYAPLPPLLHPLLHAALAQRGIEQLYTHQAAAIKHALAGRNVAVVTPTASGKTLCYNLPVFHSLLADPAARALYLFPTKALAQDQLAELNDFGTLLAAATSSPLSAAAYDGDTPSAARAQLRRESRIILTNPDMLHVGILPYHPQWAEFLAGLRYVVIDEMHSYRGIFGSHMANVLRRLRRLCAHYGATPQFVLASATIANPQTLAERLIETPVALIDENGAPRGEKHVILYNPPVYDPEHGLRRASTLEAQELAARCVRAAVQTIVFGRARQTTEILLTYLRDNLQRPPAPVQDPHAAIRGYRGGYLPTERREIEAGLRSGDVRAVVATNALELGIDIGQLQAAVLCGYPGSIAGTWQQMGRAGRTQEAALALLVATGGPLDQYVIQHAEFLFEQSPEHALINPDNLMLLVDHVRCAAFELPFTVGERFGACTFTDDVLALLQEDGDLLKAGPRWLWHGEGYPARAVSLRSAGQESVVIQATGDAGPAVIGEIDHASAPLLVHEGAVYIHQGDSYLINQLDFEANVAQAEPVTIDFYTEASAEVEIDVLKIHDERVEHGAQIAHGELLVTSQVVGYRRVKRFTHETLGVFPLDYTPQQLDTSGYWFGIQPAAQQQLAQAGRWHDSINDYGPNWQDVRAKVRARDGYRCSQCGAPENPVRQHDVHHIMPFRTFGYVAGVNDAYREANRLDNLRLLCRACHQRLEATVRVRSGLDGLAYALANLAPLHLMCDRGDLGVTVMRGVAMDEAGMALTQEVALPTIYLFERIAAGLGFSTRLFELHETLVYGAEELVRRCSCPHGCPACVGPVLEEQAVRLETKQLTLGLLEVLQGKQPSHKAAPSEDIHFG